MAGGTHVFDMIKRQKENASIKHNKRYFKAHAHSVPSNLQLGDGQKETNYLHEEILRVLLREKSNELKKSILIFSFSTIVVMVFILLLFFS
jgi:hypothetical protein